MPTTNVSIENQSKPPLALAVYTVRISATERNHLQSQSTKPTNYLRSLIQSDMKREVEANA